MKGVVRSCEESRQDKIDDGSAPDAITSCVLSQPEASAQNIHSVLGGVRQRIDSSRIHETCRRLILAAGKGI